MPTESYEIDPNGDVLLRLRNARPPFAVWDETQVYPSSLPDPASPDIVDEIFTTEPALMKKEKKRKEKREKRRVIMPLPEPSPEPFDEPFAEPPDEPSSAPLDEGPAVFNEFPVPSDEPPAPPNESPAPLDDPPVIVERVEIRVSSHHLTLASPYYSRMLKGEWKEADTLRKNGSVEVEVEDLDADALVILMKIIHGKTRTVPRAVTVEMLAKIAVVVNFYQCYEAVEIFTDMWIAHLRSNLPEEYSRDTVLWICISLVFRQHDEFRSATSAAMKYSSAPIQDLGLPISQGIVDGIAQRREEAIERILIALRKLAKDLLEDLYGCSFDCRCTLLGALMKAMHARSLPLSHPAYPFIRLSFAEMVRYFRTFRFPELCEYRRRERSYYSGPDECDLRSCIFPVLDSLENHMNGLLLEDFLSVF